MDDNVKDVVCFQLIEKYEVAQITSVFIFCPWTSHRTSSSASFPAGFSWNYHTWTNSLGSPRWLSASSSLLPVELARCFLLKSGDHRIWNVMRAVVEFDRPSPSTGISFTPFFLLEWHTHIYTHRLKLSHLTHRDKLQNECVCPADVQSLLISLACRHLPLFFYAW